MDKIASGLKTTAKYGAKGAKSGYNAGKNHYKKSKEKRDERDGDGNRRHSSRYSDEDDYYSDDDRRRDRRDRDRDSYRGYGRDDRDYRRDRDRDYDRGYGREPDRDPRSFPPPPLNRDYAQYKEGSTPPPPNKGEYGGNSDYGNTYKTPPPSGDNYDQHDYNNRGPPSSLPPRNNQQRNDNRGSGPLPPRDNEPEGYNNRDSPGPLPPRNNQQGYDDRAPPGPLPPRNGNQPLPASNYYQGTSQQRNTDQHPSDSYYNTNDYNSQQSQNDYNQQRPVSRGYNQATLPVRNNDYQSYDDGDTRSQQNPGPVFEVKPFNREENERLKEENKPKVNQVDVSNLPPPPIRKDISNVTNCSNNNSAAWQGSNASNNANEAANNNTGSNQPPGLPSRDSSSNTNNTPKAAVVGGSYNYNVDVGFAPPPKPYRSDDSRTEPNKPIPNPTANTVLPPPPGPSDSTNDYNAGSNVPPSLPSRDSGIKVLNPEPIQILSPEPIQPIDSVKPARLQQLPVDSFNPPPQPFRRDTQRGNSNSPSPSLPNRSGPENRRGSDDDDRLNDLPPRGDPDLRRSNSRRDDRPHKDDGYGMDEGNHPTRSSRDRPDRRRDNEDDDRYNKHHNSRRDSDWDDYDSKSRRPRRGGPRDEWDEEEQSSGVKGFFSGIGSKLRGKEDDEDDDYYEGENRKPPPKSRMAAEDKYGREPSGRARMSNDRDIDSRKPQSRRDTRSGEDEKGFGFLSKFGGGQRSNEDDEDDGRRRAPSGMVRDYDDGDDYNRNSKSDRSRRDEKEEEKGFGFLSKFGGGSRSNNDDEMDADADADADGYNSRRNPHSNSRKEGRDYNNRNGRDGPRRNNRIDDDWDDDKDNRLPPKFRRPDDKEDDRSRPEDSTYNRYDNKGGNRLPPKSRRPDNFEHDNWDEDRNRKWDDEKGYDDRNKRQNQINDAPPPAGRRPDQIDDAPSPAGRRPDQYNDAPPPTGRRPDQYDDAPPPVGRNADQQYNAPSSVNRRASDNPSPHPATQPATQPVRIVMEDRDISSPPPTHNRNTELDNDRASQYESKRNTDRVMMNSNRQDDTSTTTDTSTMVTASSTLPVMGDISKIKLRNTGSNFLKDDSSVTEQIESKKKNSDDYSSNLKRNVSKPPDSKSSIQEEEEPDFMTIRNRLNKTSFSDTVKERTSSSSNPVIDSELTSPASKFSTRVTSPQINSDKTPPNVPRKAFSSGVKKIPPPVAAKKPNLDVSKKSPPPVAPKKPVIFEKKNDLLTVTNRFQEISTPKTSTPPIVGKKPIVSNHISSLKPGIINTGDEPDFNIFKRNLKHVPTTPIEDKNDKDEDDWDNDDDKAQKPRVEPRSSEPAPIRRSNPPPPPPPHGSKPIVKPRAPAPPPKARHISNVNQNNSSNEDQEESNPFERYLKAAVPTEEDRLHKN
ncbi:hypothetical protein TBLA_0H01570 [Henningerozyma blattae CBS 6284]|uniref:Uncharacterized protein n=1 Tax=Henningerozyma blattae (strain ATCC 34711 / CBS 6284 / DSM 70876 / NBRC 10599 / NRRL Y-10934 / UCD 77-7) TaxID=1071380 RepID=I2H7U2_HENB6|nr:hypothetical protein TBLA_0H01570 [Tetrapisispora blattae CBS 6284]CCH62444.1 hypothetical protein TBLA_0H01570 [Tetrapisispora blattae CBS 6284]